MKKILKISIMSIMICFMALSYLYVIVGVAKSKSVVFHDKNLENVVRKIIAKPVGEINADDVSKIEKLSLENKNITNIFGLENFKNLKKLALDFNQISNLEPIGGLTKLTVLTLDMNKISDIEPLKNLKKLEILYIGHNRISKYKVID